MLVVAYGLHALYAKQKWLCLLVLLWVVAGVNMQTATKWSDYIAGRHTSFLYPPWQVIAPMVAQDERDPQLIGYRTSTKILDWPSYVGFSQRQYYFDNAGVGVRFATDPHDFDIMMHHSVISSPHIWLMFQTSVVSDEEVAAIESTMATLEYEHCSTHRAGTDTLIWDYSWSVLECSAIDKRLEAPTDLIANQYYGGNVGASGSALYVADAWSPTVEFTQEDYMFSYQLISKDRGNVAQLDLPLVHEGEPRRFSIDVSNVEPGNYRLVAILYNKHTGERESWHDDEGNIPDMLTLAEIVIPER